MPERLSECVPRSGALRTARREPVGSVVVLSLGALDFGLETSIVLPALPALARHYGASLVEVGWFATAFQLVAVAVVPLLGRLGDLVGKRRVLIFALLAFAAGSLLCAATSVVGLAIAGRAIQGAGGAVGPLGLGIARDTLPRERVPRAIGVLVGGATCGGALGFLLSGLLVDRFSPTAIFWFLLAFAIVLAVATAAYVPESPHRAAVHVDVIGALLISAGLVALLLAISEGNRWGWTSGRIIGLFVAAAGTLALFAVVEARVPQPLIDPALVTRRPFAGANLCALLFGFAFFLATYLIPQIAASPGLALSTTKIGLLLTPACVVAFAAAWLAGRVVTRRGPRALVAAGSLVGAAGYLSLAVAHGSVGALVAGSAAIGVSWGLILTGIYAAVMRTVTPERSGVAAAVAVTMRITGTAIGVQGAFALIAAAAEAGFTRAFLVGAIGAGATFVASVLLPGARRDAAPRWAERVARHRPRTGSVT